MKVATGSYVGNGTTKVINGLVTPGALPVNPSLGGVIIHAITWPGTQPHGVIRTGTMTGDKTKDIYVQGTPAADMIESLDSNGFTVGSHAWVNQNGTTYGYVAWEADGDHASAIGTYTGNGIDGRLIPTGIDLNMVIVYSETGGNVNWRSTDMVGDVTSGFRANGVISNAIQGISGQSFEVGTIIDTNQNAGVYHWAAFKNSEIFRALTWVGNATDNRSITAGMGNQPSFAVAGHHTSTGATFGKFVSQTGDASQAFDWQPETNRIQAFEADGIQIGSANDVNMNGVTVYGFVMADGVTIPPPPGGGGGSTPPPPPPPTDVFNPGKGHGKGGVHGGNQGGGNSGGGHHGFDPPGGGHGAGGNPGNPGNSGGGNGGGQGGGGVGPPPVVPPIDRPPARHGMSSGVVQPRRRLGGGLYG